jgi:transposase InsO family protein
MIYQFIVEHPQEFPVERMCKVLSVSVSGYYAWKQRTASERQRVDEQLMERLRHAYQHSHGVYGSRRLHAQLRSEGSRCGRKRVVRLMRELGLCTRRPAHPSRTTDSQHEHPVAENLLAQEFSAQTPNTKWVTDITGVWTGEGWLYVAVVLDLFSRMLVGWAMGAHRDTQLVEQACEMALARRQPEPGLLHHSDRGSQYTSEAYRTLLQQAGIRVSISRKGNCYDNAVMESFFGSLKSEWTDRHTYATRREARQSIFEYMEVFYNRQRLHSSLGYMSPVSYEQRNG